jgi:hypothetical protein
MKKQPELNTKEMLQLGKLLERANQNGQLSVGIGDVGYATQEIIGVCDNGDDLELQVMPKGVKWLWVRYQGMMGGFAKARKRKVR